MPDYGGDKRREGRRKPDLWRQDPVGYTIDNVTANDEDLEADSVTDELDGSQTAWYTISEVYEEQNIQVYTLETLEHPAFDKSVEVNGVTIRITAPEGVLPADTQIQAEEITEQVESALTEKVDAESDDGTVSVPSLHMTSTLCMTA